ncbi:hypothetical protein CHUAL_009014 [Chamberlinius hualienensis]
MAPTADNWIYDSGATSHFCVDRSKFYDYEEIETNIQLADANVQVKSTEEEKQTKNKVNLEAVLDEIDEEPMQQRGHHKGENGDVTPADFTREVKGRNMSNRKEVFYYPKTGPKMRLRSTNDLQRYCRANGLNYDASQFDFKTKGPLPEENEQQSNEAPVAEDQQQITEEVTQPIEA